MDEARDDRRDTIAVLLDDLREILTRLDKTGAPSDVGAHIDLAIVRLEAFLTIMR